MVDRLSASCHSVSRSWSSSLSLMRPAAASRAEREAPPLHIQLSFVVSLWPSVHTLHTCRWPITATDIITNDLRVCMSYFSNGPAQRVCFAL